MDDENRFTDQKLDSKDYAAEERRANAVKGAVGLIGALVSFAIVGGKLAPKIAKEIDKNTKV